MRIFDITLRESKFHVNLVEISDQIYLDNFVVEINTTSAPNFSLTHTEFNLLYEAMTIWKRNRLENEKEE